jgi:hypothetical protein
MHVIQRGVVFDTRTASTNQRSASATSTLACSDGTVLVTCRLGTEREGPDGHTAIFASDDAGASWELRFLSLGEREWDGVRGETRGWYLAEIEPGVLIASVLWVDRSDPARPWVNPETQGLLPMLTYQLTSTDGGRTWGDRHRIDLGPSPAASPTGPVRRLRDGGLAQPFEHWKEHGDPDPGRPAALLRLSLDEGRTWDDELTVARHPSNELFYWDQRLATHPDDGRLVAMFWTHEPGAGMDRDVHIAWGDPLARTWTTPAPTGLPGQHCQPIALGGDRLLAVYTQRRDPPGVRVALSQDFGATWDHDGAIEVYSSEAGREPGTGAMRAQEDFWNDMGTWQFGHPSGALLPSGEVLVVFYGGSGQTRPLRWRRLGV